MLHGAPFRLPVAGEGGVDVESLTSHFADSARTSWEATSVSASWRLVRGPGAGSHVEVIHGLIAVHLRSAYG